MVIRKAGEADLEEVLAVERATFGGEVEAELVRSLLNDPTAQPVVSLLAFDEGKAVGHILFTQATVETEYPAAAMILAPLAVVPHAQRQGVGGGLIERGVEVLKARGVDLVFVLGHPGYYPRFGFQPAAPHGWIAPFEIPAYDIDAWMVHQPHPDRLLGTGGRVRCAEAMNRPEYWRE